MKNILYLFNTRRFFPLFIAQFFATFNNNAFKNALLIWITYKSCPNIRQHASMMVTLAAILFVLPFFLFSATAGQFADKYPKSDLTQKIRSFDVFLMIACTVGFILQNSVFLLVVLFLMGTQAAFFGPLKYSLLPENLRNTELITGNALIESATFLAILLGTVAGGLIIDIHRGTIYLLILLLFFSLISWLVSYLIPKNRAIATDLCIQWNIIAATWKIITYARSIKRVWVAVTAISWFWALGGIFLTQFPIYTKQVIHGNADIVTWFLALFSIGIGIGSMFCNKLLKGKISLRLTPWSCLGMSLFIIDFYFASQTYQVSNYYFNELTLSLFLHQCQGIYISLALLLLAICSGVYVLPLYAVIQHESEQSHVSRMIAVNNIINALYMVLGNVVTLVLFSIGLNVKMVFLSVGVVNLLFVFFLI